MKTMPKPNYLCALADLRNGLDGLRESYGRHDVEIEIGCGDGGFLHWLASNNPDCLYVGFEKDYTWASKAAKKTHDLPNAIVFCTDIRKTIHAIAGRGRADAVWMNFPDPWPKTKHSARRLSITTFTEELQTILKENGLYHLATDVEEYQEALGAAFAETSAWQILAEAPRSKIAFQTKFEQRWRGMNKSIYFLATKLLEPLKVEAKPQISEAEVKQELNRLPAVIRAHDTEWRRGALVARVIRTRRKTPFVTFNIAHLHQPFYSVVKMELTHTNNGPRWVWINLSEWILVEDEAKLVLDVALGKRLPATARTTE